MSRSPHATARAAWSTLLTLSLGTWLVATLFVVSAHAEATVIPLGTAQPFSVLAGSRITNTGPSTVAGSIGVSPGTAITDAGTLVVGGTTHAGDAVAASAKTDLTTAYDNAAGQTPPIAADDELAGETLVGGVYNRSAAMALNGPLTLDGQNDPNSVWVFQAGTTLTTAGSSVLLVNGADPCRVFWQVGSSATLGTGSQLIGTVMADQSITLQAGVRLEGRALARVGAVTLDSTVIASPACGPVGGGGGPTTTAPTTTVPTSTAPPTTVPTTTPPTSTPPTSTPPTSTPTVDPPTTTPTTAPPTIAPSTPPTSAPPTPAPPTLPPTTPPTIAPTDLPTTPPADGGGGAGPGTGNGNGPGTGNGGNGGGTGVGDGGGNGGTGVGDGGAGGSGGSGGTGGSDGGTATGGGSQVVDRPSGSVSAGVTTPPLAAAYAPVSGPTSDDLTTWWVLTALLGALAALAGVNLLRLGGSGSHRRRSGA